MVIHTIRQLFIRTIMNLQRGLVVHPRFQMVVVSRPTGKQHPLVSVFHDYRGLWSQYHCAGHHLMWWLCTALARNYRFTGSAINISSLWLNWAKEIALQHKIQDRAHELMDRSLKWNKHVCSLCYYSHSACLEQIINVIWHFRSNESATLERPQLVYTTCVWLDVLL